MGPIFNQTDPINRNWCCYVPQCKNLIVCTNMFNLHVSISIESIYSATVELMPEELEWWKTSLWLMAQ